MNNTKLDYSNLTKNELIEKLNELENKSMDTYHIDIPWAGNLGEWQWDFVANTIILNDKIATTLGYDISEVPKDVGFQFFTDKLHLDDYEKVMQNMRDYLLGKSSEYEVEFRIQAKDGNYKWYYDKGVIVKRDSSNKPLLLAGIVFDVTKNKVLEQNNALLAKLPNTNPDIIIIVNLNNEAIYINPTGKRTIKNDISEILPNDFNDALQSAYKKNQVNSISYVLDNKNYILKLKPFPGEDQCMVSISDVTELVKTKKEKNLYYEALSSIKQAMIITDKTGTIINVNREFEKLYGYLEHEAIGKNPKLLNSGINTYLNLGYSESEYNDLFKSMWSSITDINNATWQGVVINRTKDGKITWANLLINAIINDQNEISNFVCLPIDITNMVDDANKSKKELYQSIANLAEMRDDETGSHMRRVGLYSKLIARHLGLPQKQCEDIKVFAPMHDLGKVGVPDSILLAPRKLTDEEFEIMKKHTIYGYNIVKKNKDMSLVSDIALYHHEKFDGSGYPYGLKGKEIPISARIVALADVYDALRSKRPYKEKWTHEETLEQIRKSSGSHFAPDIVDLFLKLNNQFATIYNEIVDNV